MSLEPTSQDMAEAFATPGVPTGAVEPTPAPLPDKPRQTLADLLKLLSDADEAAMVEFDPAQLLGEVKDKVDAVQAVLDLLEFQAAWNKQQAEPFLRRAGAFSRNHKRLEEYVLFWMRQEKFQQLPGNAFKVLLKNNQPSLETIGEADAATYMKFPNYVEPVRGYRWNNAAIKTALMDKRAEVAGGKPVAELGLTFTDDALPFAKLTTRQKIVFEPNTPEKVPAKPKKEAKK